LSYYPIPETDAHFEHFTHYNNGGDEIGKYYAYEAVQPQYARPGESSQIMFSIQDSNRNDVKIVNAMVEIYSGVSGERLKIYPWTVYSTGDFEVNYTFPRSGPYQLVLSLSSDLGIEPIENSPMEPSRYVLSSTINCKCDRAIFNVSISENFGSVYNLTILAAVIGPIAVLGSVLGLTYRKRMRSGNYSKSIKNEVLKYSLMLLAISGGLVHFAVYSEHASLRIEYSIFLIIAGASQVVYGVLYILHMLRYETSWHDNKSAKSYYRKGIILNLFGLIGSLILIGLYFYTTVFPPPISPNAKAEEIELAGILAKSSEILLVIGIVYIIRSEKKKFDSHVIHIT